MPTKGYCKKCRKIIFNIKNRSGYCIKCSPFIGRYTRNKEHRKKMSLKLSGKNNPMFGKIAWNRNITHTKETRDKISKSRIGKYVKEKNPAWKGGKSFEFYPFEWTEIIKEQIRRRDNYKCQICGIPQKKCIRCLDVHHIDCNKKNCKENNLISLCAKCHADVHNKSPQ